MSRGMSGLAAAISGEAHTGVSENAPEPPRVKCKWKNCGTTLRIGNRKPLGRRSPMLDPVPCEEPAEALVEAANEAPTPVKKKKKKGNDERKLDGLCDLHKQMTRDYDLGHSGIRPPFYPPPKPIEIKKKRYEPPLDD